MPEASRRAYRALLGLLPRDFRERFGPEMEELFAYRLRRARTRRGRIWVRVRAVVDVLGHAFVDRVRARHTSRQRGNRGTGEGGMGTMLQDLRYALRTLGRTPLFATISILTLALGIGASTATFSVVRTVLFEALPYPAPDRLVTLWSGMNFNNAMVRDAVASMPAIESASGISGWGLTLIGEGQPLEVDANRVSPSHFRVLGVAPALGRAFRDEEGLPGRGDVVVLSHAFWLRVFGGDAGVIGRTIQISGGDSETRTVIGVMPSDFRPVFHEPDVWIPMSLDPAATVESDDSWYVNERVARLAPGATLEQARQQIRRFAATVDGAVEFLDDDAVRAARIEPLGEYVGGDLRPVLWAALGAVSLVLLIACANVANLLLARGESRGHDLAVRSALGAGRRRVVRMLLAESAVAGLAGGALGIAASFALVRLVVSLAPTDFPRIDEVGVDGDVLAYAVAITLLATLVAGLAPALRMSRVEATAALGGAARGTGARRSSRVTRVLVGAEVALAVVVTVGSGLMVRSLVRLTSMDVGVDLADVLVVQPSPPSGRYASTEDHVTYFDRVFEAVAAVPGVEAVGGIHLLPGAPGDWDFPSFPEGVDVPPGTPAPAINFRMVQGDYFEAMGLEPLRGRLFTDADRGDAERVMIVNQTLVDRHWPGLDPIGRTIRTFSATSEPFRVVGVVGDVRQQGFGPDPDPQMYVPMAQWTFGDRLWLIVRAGGGRDPMAHAAALQDAIWSVDRDVPLSEVEELAEVYDRSAASTRFLTLVLGSFGALALLLGAIGVFGVTAFAVGRRIPEFGVRLALGASRGSVLRAGLMTSGVPVAVGLVVGIAAAALTSRILRSVLYRVEPSDPLTFGAVGATMLAVALLASLLPAWRASRVDPVRVLTEP